MTPVEKAALAWRDMRNKVCNALNDGKKINMCNPEWDLGAKEADLVDAIHEMEYQLTHTINRDVYITLSDEYFKAQINSERFW